ncbi:ornithine cyclodeaminase family protein [Pseudomonas sp. NPDC089752]|uniref:ornithine cyclodeaminase family protein n=1 Tax=Pseudomonas sp. NPDC089752 TaxID=3364472 RepID=UPI00381CB383
MQIISKDQIEAVAEWGAIIQALHNGHLGDRPQNGEFFVGDAEAGLFSRGVVLAGVGAGVKIASIRAGNAARTPSLPNEHAAFLYIEEQTGVVGAFLDGPAITQLKTAADSALAASLLSREDSEVLLVLGAGPIARALTEAYLHVRPKLRHMLLWNRTPAKLEHAVQRIASLGVEVSIVDELEQAVSRADIIVSATSTATPLIAGRCVRPGTHVDLVGGYRADMQEADVELVGKARIFADDRASALASGDLCIPLSQGVIEAGSIEADLFELCQRADFSRSSADITLYKNAGGAHLDLIVSRYVLAAVNA